MFRSNYGNERIGIKRKEKSPTNRRGALCYFDVKWEMYKTLID